MAGVEGLIQAYRAQVALPWDPGLAGPQRVWFALYNPLEERRLRYRLPAFEVETLRAGHGWRHLDLVDLFPEWMAKHEYRDRYFRSPGLLKPALEGFARQVSESVRRELAAPGVDEQTVVAVSGVASLFGLTRFSRVLRDVEGEIPGRLLAFFPGEHDGASYRLLDARDDWNYHAVPITAQENGC